MNKYNPVQVSSTQTIPMYRLRSVFKEKGEVRINVESLPVSVGTPALVIVSDLPYQTVVDNWERASLG